MQAGEPSPSDRGATVERVDEERLTDHGARAEVRAREMARIPAGYSPVFHFVKTSFWLLGAAAVGIAMVRDMKPLEWLVIPFHFAFANAAEWAAHRGLLHKRFIPFPVPYDRHTRQHHACFTYDEMEVRTRREWGLVLMPSFGMPLIVMASAPMSLLVAFLFGANAGWLMVAASGLYVWTYEVLHLSYHLPKSSWIGQTRIIRALGEHHRRHHHPRLMRRWNFNVTIPLHDWIRGTIAGDELLAEAVEKDRARREDAHFPSDATPTASPANLRPVSPSE